MSERRALVAGWFSFEGMGATAGDLLSRDVASGWLTDAGIAHDVAHAAAFPGGVDWRSADPQRYSELIFVCGPFYVRRRLVRLLTPTFADGLVRAAPALARIGADPLRRLPLELLVARFAGTRLVGLNLSILGPAGARQPFDLLFERDAPTGPARPDLAFAAPRRAVPVVGLLLAEPQAEYPSGAHEAAEGAIDGLLRSRDVAVVPVDTRLDPPNAGGLRTPAEIESVIARMDAVVTTRLHGAVLAVRNGVPALVVDPIPGGAKVRRQAETIGWPVVFAADSLDPVALGDALAFVLSPEARDLAVRCSSGTVPRLDTLRREFLAGLGP